MTMSATRTALNRPPEFESVLASYIKMAKDFRTKLEIFLLENNSSWSTDEDLSPVLLDLKADLNLEYNRLLLTFKKGCDDCKMREDVLADKVKRLAVKARLLNKKIEQILELGKSENNTDLYDKIIKAEREFFFIKKNVILRNRLRRLNSARIGRFIKMFEAVRAVHEATMSYENSINDFREVAEKQFNVLCGLTKYE